MHTKTSEACHTILYRIPHQKKNAATVINLYFILVMYLKHNSGYFKLLVDGDGIFVFPNATV